MVRRGSSLAPTAAGTTRAPGRSSSDGREVDAIGGVGALVPRVHLGGGHPFLVPVHLEVIRGRGRDRGSES